MRHATIRRLLSITSVDHYLLSQFVLHVAQRGSLAARLADARSARGQSSSGSYCWLLAVSERKESEGSHSYTLGL